MGFLEKLKLLFKVQKPVGEISKAVKEVRKSKKWLHFTVTILGSLATTAGALSGIIPPVAQLIAVTVLQGAYNILRGADKADDNEVKGVLRTTEFWTTGLAELQKMIVVMQAGGVNPEWFAASSATIGALLAAGQNLASRKPADAKAALEEKK